MALNNESVEYSTLPQQQQLYVSVVGHISGFTGNERQTVYSSSVTLFILLSLTLFAIIKYNFGNNLYVTFQAFFNYRQTKNIFNERRESDRQAVILSNILFSLVVGLFISIIFPFWGETPLWGSYALSIIFFSTVAGLLYYLKAIVWKALGTIFMLQSFSQLYVYNMHLVNRITGFVILPFVALIPYVVENIVPYLIYTVLIFFVISYFFKIFRIFQIINAQNVSILHFILYLCALEFLPLLLFVKSCKILSESIVI